MYRFPFGVPAQPYPLAVSKLETNFSNEAFSFLSLSLSFHPLIPFLPKRSIPGRSCAIGCLEWSEFQANFSRLIRMVNWNRLSSLQRVVVIVEQIPLPCVPTICTTRMYNLIAKPSSYLLPFLYYPRLITVRIIVVTSSIVWKWPRRLAPTIPTRETDRDAVVIPPHPLVPLLVYRELNGTRVYYQTDHRIFLFLPCSRPFLLQGKIGNLVE